ncbi:hypothetical protein [Kineococcus aurantiacus]|uniref:Uncharacterized protein n=1 Tax=Kineococcus aurantiacus TaxID=37633 RepID=A0A7Y9DGM5_9ACTN|nr:hypothetical protein [Kineococcus aurantiacus]
MATASTSPRLRLVHRNTLGPVTRPARQDDLRGVRRRDVVP